MLCDIKDYNMVILSVHTLYKTVLGLVFLALQKRTVMGGL